MGIFGKPKLTEHQAAADFVATMLQGAPKHWPAIAAEINTLLRDKESIAVDMDGMYEFVLAAIACQMQALPKLLPTDQARRVRKHIIQVSSPPELGDRPSKTIEEYQKAWDQSLLQKESPACGIAGVLLEKLGCQSFVEFGDDSFKNPLLIMEVSGKIVRFGAPFWKEIMKRYRLVP